MNNIRLFDEDELESLVPTFEKVCKEKRYEGIILISDECGELRAHHSNPDLGFFAHVSREELLCLVVGQKITSAEPIEDHKGQS